MSEVPKNRGYRHVTAVYLAALLAIVTGLIYSQSATASPSASSARYTAGQLADAIMFGQGPAAVRLVGAHRPEAKMTPQMATVRTEVHSYLDHHAAFAASFAQRVQSGNRVQVAAGLSDLGTVAKTSMQRQMTQDQYSATLRNAQTALSSLGKTTTRAAAPDSGVVNYVQTINYDYYYAAAAVYGAVAIIILIFLICPPCAVTGVAGSTQVATDRFVNTMAQGLAVR